TRQRADVVCLQETKAQRHQLDDRLYHPRSFHDYFVDAEKKGYSGVAIYARREPDAVITSLREAADGAAAWDEFDREGRYVEARFGKLSVVSLYLPSGTSGDERQAVKMRFLDRFGRHLDALARSDRQYVFCGDWNIAHKRIDIKNWRSNQKHSGFLPEERAFLDEVFDRKGYVDAFREIDPREAQYTWWSNRGQAYANNVGWRIDYQVLSPSLQGTVAKARIYRDKKFSDHAPLIIDYAW
ncbi:MAG: exodeoxyribonuclease III, partial [Pseudomonadota bacterium]